MNDSNTSKVPTPSLSSQLSNNLWGHKRIISIIASILSSICCVIHFVPKSAYKLMLRESFLVCRPGCESCGDCRQSAYLRCCSIINHQVGEYKKALLNDVSEFDTLRMLVSSVIPYWYRLWLAINQLVKSKNNSNGHFSLHAEKWIKY
jgi:hypothetical protein